MEESLVKNIRDLDHMIKDCVSEGKDTRKILNYTQFRILAYLVKHKDEETCQKDLEVETNLKKASITSVIDNLENRGYVKRTESKEDRRRNIIELSEMSKEIVENLDFRLKNVESKMTNNISENDLDVFFKVIKKMQENIKKVTR